MDTPDSLLQVHRIPWQVKIEEHSGVLQVDALAPCRCADQDPWPIRCFESFLRRCLCPVVATFQYRDALAGKLFLDFRTEHLHAAEICGEYDHPLLRVLSPQFA